MGGTGMSRGYTYRLPDGSADTPDENGMHTATVNVLHSAEQYKRFTGCGQCKLSMEMDIHYQHVTTHFGGWDAETETFAEHSTTTEFTPGCVVCERQNRAGTS